MQRRTTVLIFIAAAIALAAYDRPPAGARAELPATKPVSSADGSLREARQKISKTLQNLDTMQHSANDLRERARQLSYGVDELERTATELDARASKIRSHLGHLQRRLAEAESRVGDAQAEIKAIEAEIVQTRLAIHRMRRIAEEFAYSHPAPPLMGPIAVDACAKNATNADFDGDGIPDDVEAKVLAAAKPILYLNSNEEVQPISVTEFRRFSRPEGDHLSVTDYEAALTHAGAKLYGRVSHPPGYPERIYVVQYYALFLLNMKPGMPGFHEADFICLDYTVDCHDPMKPNVICAIYHNHGRQLFIEARTLSFEGTHPLAFLEGKGENEPWPHRAIGGLGSWDQSNGITTNKIFKGKTVFDIGDEGDVVEDHHGDASRLDLPVLNIGEIDSTLPGPAVRAVDVRKPGAGITQEDLDESRFLVEYTGRWGKTDYWLFEADVDLVFYRYHKKWGHVDSPEGPVQNSGGKMWYRNFRYGDENPNPHHTTLSTFSVNRTPDQNIITWSVVPFCHHYRLTAVDPAGNERHFTPGYSGVPGTNGDPLVTSFCDDANAGLARGVHYVYKLSYAFELEHSDIAEQP